MVLTSLLLSQVQTDIKDDIDTNFTHGAVGNDGTTPTAADTTLGNEQFIDTVDSVDKSVTNAVTVSLRVLSSENNGKEIREVGWFNAGASGTMWAKDVITLINKTSDIQVFLDLTTTVTVTEGS